MDRSWGVTGSRDVVAERRGVRDVGAAGSTPAAGEASSRTNAVLARIDARARERGEAALEREQARREGREARSRLAREDPHDPAARQPRASGRRDIVRQRRDTSGYSTVVDEERVRTLAARGATVDGLAKVFGLARDEVERILEVAT